MKASPEEYTARFERLRGRMSKAGLDAVLLGTGMNLAYFTGYPSPLGSVARPFFALLPVHADPVFFSHSGHVLEARRFSWIPDVRDYMELSCAPVREIRDAVRERGVADGRIGMELGYEQTLDISQIEFCGLKEALIPAELVDAADVLWSLRMIKSAFEVECMRQACRLTACAYRATFSAVREGMPENEIYAHMRRRLDGPETGNLFLVITSGKGNYDLVTKLPENRSVRPGEMVWMDAGCTVSGYWSDFSRAGVIGGPSDEQKRAQEAIQCITAEAVKQIRPGIAASSIARFCLSRIDELPFTMTSVIARLAGRIGHGIGLNLTEPPHLGLHDDTPLEAGMVVSVEPGVATAYGTFHVEENVLVTEDGHEVISNAPRELTVLGATHEREFFV